MNYDFLKDYGFTSREIALIEKCGGVEGIGPRAMAKSKPTEKTPKPGSGLAMAELKCRTALAELRLSLLKHRAAEVRS